MEFVLELWDRISQSIETSPIPDEVKPWLYLVLPILFVVVASIYTLFIKYLFASGPTNLQSPGEKRRVERIAYIDSLLANELNEKESERNLLLEERASLIFEHLHGVKNTKAYMREELQSLHAHSNSFVDWKAIRTAYPSLREKNFKLVKGLRVEDKIAGAFAILLGLLVFLLGAAIALRVAFSSADTANTAVAWTLFLLFSLVSMLPLSLAIPMIRALQLGKWLPEEVQRNNAPPNPNQQRSYDQAE